jgi:hypothetical protein
MPSLRDYFISAMSVMGQVMFCLPVFMAIDTARCMWTQASKYTRAYKRTYISTIPINSDPTAEKEGVVAHIINNQILNKWRPKF